MGIHLWWWMGHDRGQDCVQSNGVSGCTGTHPQFPIWLFNEQDLDGQYVLLRNREKDYGLQVLNCKRIVIIGGSDTVVLHWILHKGMTDGEFMIVKGLRLQEWDAMKGLHQPLHLHQQLLQNQKLLSAITLVPNLMWESRVEEFQKRVK